MHKVKPEQLAKGSRRNSAVFFWARLTTEKTPCRLKVESQHANVGVARSGASGPKLVQGEQVRSYLASRITVSIHRCILI